MEAHRGHAEHQEPAGLAVPRMFTPQSLASDRSCTGATHGRDTIANDHGIRYHHFPRTTTFRSTPTPSTSISTTSPGLIARVVCGVPVKITSPGRSVTYRLR